MASILGNGVTNYATHAYDDLGRRVSVTRANGVTTTYGNGPASRLAAIAQDFPGGTHDVTFGSSHNPAGQIVTRSVSNALYNDPAPPTGTTTYTVNGLNQTGEGYVYPYDAKCNLLGDGARGWTYD